MEVPIGIAEQAPLQEILGYLNFSSGASDPAFLRRVSELWEKMATASVAPKDYCAVAQQLLANKLKELAASNATFQNAEQAQYVLPLVFEELLPAYRRHHRDLLFHQTDADLWQPFFIGRAAEAVLTVGPPWTESKRIVKEAIGRLNDFIGYRPVPVLETHKHAAYAHERVRPVPLFIAGAGVAVGKYRELIEQTLEILRNTDPEVLEAAWFDLTALDELAFDPRAYDFNHPVNRRPNYHFGTWDQHLIDNKGRYRRFVLQQCMLDAVLTRVKTTNGLSREEAMYEAGAVLAGTILMASGTTGSGPETHDSSVSLATLLPVIARYRDRFYQQLLAQASGERRKRLEEEATIRRQPFAGARQHLNTELARLRALQLQHVQLALIFARLGYSEAAMRQSEIVPAASARMVCQMECLLAEGHRAADAGKLNDAFAVLPQIEDLLRRAIECGAVIDPWNILGFGGQFSLFPAMENAIPDPRVDELLELMEQIFALYASVWHAAAIADDVEVQKRVATAFRHVAQWWDRFATTAVEGIEDVSGGEAAAAAERVAGALAAWHKAGAAAGQVSFWRPQVEEFDSPQAYSRVIEVLLDKPDLQAAMALLMQWLSEAEKVRLGEGGHSFYALAIYWLQTALGTAPAALEKNQTEPRFDPTMVLKFFDYLEANADPFWDVPQWLPGEAEPNRPGRAPETSLGDELELEGEKDEEDDLFSAAYESMVFRDSTADNIDANMLEAPGSGDRANDELEQQFRQLSPRLAFLAMLAEQWKMVAWAAGRRIGELSVPVAWFERAKNNRRELQKLARAIGQHPIDSSSAGYDALVEYDRRRLTREMLLEKVVATLSATRQAELLLRAVGAAQGASAESEEEVEDATAEAAESESDAEKSGKVPDGSQIVGMMSLVMAGDASAVRNAWGAFLAEVVNQPLLYVPLSRGGDARKIAAARALQQVFRELLRQLPRLGLLRETCQLLRVARAMEKRHPAGPGSVTEFDRLFEIGYQGIVESLVESSLDWQRMEPVVQSTVEGDDDPDTNADAEDEETEHDDPGADLQLIDCLQQVTESLLTEWLSHSRTLRLSVLERVTTDKAWEELVAFVERYGHDLFTQQFFHLGNLRAILHQGVDTWLEQLAEDEDADEKNLLLKELDHGLSRAEAKKHLSLIIEAIVENYAEYRDYNATTTQSDRGEMLYTLLDFLRVKVGYERIHWNLRPIIMAHQVLIRRGLTSVAELWRRAMAHRTNDVAEQQLKRLAKLQTQYGMRLSTVADRLGERFVRPLVIDRVRALVEPAAREAQLGEPPTAFALLEQEASELADEPSGAGLDLPDWLETLESEVDRVVDRAGQWNPEEESSADAPWARLTWEEIQSQLADWDTPPEISR